MSSSSTIDALPDEVLYLVHTTSIDPKTVEELRPSEMSTYQYPGVFFSLITKDNKNAEFIYPDGDKILIFSPKLLLQSNWHANLTDHQGFISENNTFYPWNTEDILQ